MDRLREILVVSPTLPLLKTTIGRNAVVNKLIVLECRRAYGPTLCRNSSTRSNAASLQLDRHHYQAIVINRSDIRTIQLLPASDYLGRKPRQCFGPSRELPAYIDVRWLGGCLFALAVLAWRSGPRFCAAWSILLDLMSRETSVAVASAFKSRIPQRRFPSTTIRRRISRSSAPAMPCAGGERAPERKGVRRITAWGRRVAKSL
jgi:hypothetical protein